MSIALPALYPWITSQVEPGTLFLLQQGEYGHGTFRAVVACPGCGTLALITQAQYVGLTPVICGAERCCAEYTLVHDQIRFRPPQ